MNETAFTLGDVAVTVGQMLAAAAGLILVLFAVVAVALARATRARRRADAVEEVRARQFSERMEALARTQAETIGGLRAMNESISGRQAELARVVGESLNSATHRLNQSLSST